jgi:hypothetical protein
VQPTNPDHPQEKTMSKDFKPAQDFEDGDAPAIELKPVDSSQVKAIGYDPATQTLACTFTRGPGHIYHYPNVTPEQHAAFVGAESIGTHFGKHIKPLAFKKYRAPAQATA